MDILVTGAAGYIGSHIVKNLLKKSNRKIIIIDNISTGNMNIIDVLKRLDTHHRIIFYRISLSDIKKINEIFQTHNISEIIHFAAFSQVGESMNEPIKYYENNTMNTMHLIDIASKNGVKKFIFSSTAATYGEPNKDDVPIKETVLTKPINPYGSSKLMSEKILQDTALVNTEFKFVILRYFNVCGADFDFQIGECHDPETHLIPLIAKTVLGKREKIFIYGDDYDTPDGTCVRDYIHVEDLSSAHLMALDYLENNDSDIFNCGYGYGYSVKQIVEKMKEVSQLDFKVEIAARRIGDPAVLIAESSKIRQKMGWEPKYNDLELICKTALEWEKKI